MNATDIERAHPAVLLRRRLGSQPQASALARAGAEAGMSFGSSRADLVARRS
jgi:hypothetical protein